jgi:hypothetical protein
MAVACVALLWAAPAAGSVSAGADTAGLHAFRVWLDRERKGYGCDVGPAEFRNKTVAAAYPGVRFYYVLTYARGIQPPFPNSVSLVARVDSAGAVSVLKGSAPETFQLGLKRIRSAADARLDAAAVLILAMGGEARWQIAPDSITAKKKKGWLCSCQHGSEIYTSEVAFDKKGRVRSITVNTPPVP